MPDPRWRLDPYLDPDSGVLKNLAGLTDAKALEAFERTVVRAAWAPAFDRLRHSGAWTMDHWELAHRELFKDVYPFAGQIRILELTRAEGPAFASVLEIYSEAPRIFAKLAAEDGLAGLGRKDFLDRFTHYYDALNRLHPFREGNGRSQRLLMTAIAERAGHRLDWRALEVDKETFHRAAHQAREDRPEALRGLFEALIEPEARRQDRAGKTNDDPSR